MKISDLKSYLESRENLTISLPNGTPVPAHFHVTEVGESTKYFIDCGGTVRHQKVATLQLWSATDYDHRLSGDKLRTIISIAETKLGLGDLEIEVEYQGANTIEKYGLEINQDDLKLIGQLTDCLAPEKCDLAPKTMVSLNTLIAAPNACRPGSGCC